MRMSPSLPTPKPIADTAGQRFRAGNGCLERIHIHIIVSGSLHLGKPHVCFPYR